MGSQRTTNVLLFLIFLALLTNLFMRFEPKPAAASPGSIDDAVTRGMQDTPKGYMHVVSHMASGEALKVEPQYGTEKPAWDR